MPPCPCLQELPLEILREIASYTVSTRIAWATAEGKQELDTLRLIHPYLTPLFTEAIFKFSTISINPRNDAGVDHLLSFSQAHNTTRYITSLEVLAENFVQKTHCLNPKMHQLLSLCPKLSSLELTLDGHFTQFCDFPTMNNLQCLTLQGESLYTHLADLPSIAPNLFRLNIMSPTLSGPPPTAETVNQELVVAPSAAAARSEDMPPNLKFLHISNLNAPSVSNLLVELNFKPVHFSFTLLHNYDLTELAFLLCRDNFCERTLSVTMSKYKMVHPDRLQSFKRNLDGSMKDKSIQLKWPEV